MRFIALSTALLLAACAREAPPPEPPKLVRVLKVGAGGTAAPRTYSGEVRARVETTLGFRVGGKLVERLVDAGAVVRAGQPLARLDPADLRLQAVQAEAQRALADADARRFRELKAKNFVSQAAVEARETGLAAADAQAGLARNQAGYSVLVAERAGVIAQVLAEPGQVVAAGQGIVRLAPDGEREVAIQLPEFEVSGFKPGREAEVTLAAEGRPLKGVLREIAPAADPATRTFAARVSLKGGEPRLPLGMSATVRFAPSGQQKNGLTLPLAAIFQQGSQPAVWIVGADGTVTLRPVTVAGWTDGGAVVSEGLKESETVVAAGVHKLIAGEKVRIAESRR